MTCDDCHKQDKCEILCEEMEEYLSSQEDIEAPLVFMSEPLLARIDWQDEAVYKTKFIEERVTLSNILAPLRKMERQKALAFFGAYYLEMSISQLCDVFKLKRSRIYALLQDSRKEKVVPIQDA